MAISVVDPAVTEYLFSLYGTSVRYATSSSLLARPVVELLRYFRRDSLDDSDPLSLSFQAVRSRADIPLRLSPSALHLYSSPVEAAGDHPNADLTHEIIKDEGRLIMDFCNLGVLVIDNTKSQCDGYIIQPQTLPEDVIEFLFHRALIELLRYRDLYMVHATALEKNGFGILIPGSSGRGKTTSFISLLRSGYRYLSDDYPLFRNVGDHVELLPFPMRTSVTENTIAFFPELRNAPDHILRPGFYKRSFYAEELYSTSVGECCRPALMLFPKVVDAPRSRLERIPKSRAMEILLPQALLVYDTEVARREFQVLAKLAQQVECYRLHFGRDILGLPGLITPLLEQVH